MNDRILETEPELPLPDDWAGDEAVRSCTGASSLDAQIAAFLARGGAIVTVPEGTSSVDYFMPGHGTPAGMVVSRKRGTAAMVKGRGKAT